MIGNRTRAFPQSLIPTGGDSELNGASVIIASGIDEEQAGRGYCRAAEFDSQTALTRREFSSEF
jgi:hypothetical protein